MCIRDSVCTHPDGHNHSGNIHVHIVIGSVRTREVERTPYMPVSYTHLDVYKRQTPAQQLKLSFSCGRMLETTLQNYLPCYVTGADAMRCNVPVSYTHLSPAFPIPASPAGR